MCGHDITSRSHGELVDVAEEPEGDGQQEDSPEGAPTAGPLT